MVLNMYNANTEDVNSYTKLAASMDEAAGATLPKKKRAQPNWFVAEQEHLTYLIVQRNTAMTAHLNRSSRMNAQRLRQARKSLKSAISKAKNKWIESKCKMINDASSSRGGTKVSWDTVNELRGGLSKPKPSSEK